ncbi:DUF5995 family protein [Streptomyces sp. H27-D2]|uniref:DUF5995 family protein n=1 Tax=Streptomyces sp. H27-D2 TaxID=3046304 RepID=UPI002DBE3F8E|nr:DUF5995 family protein [Streptomyces sp. H27-D2]MEC4015518.1 DUF5995 family protein [Streptomyces sp. H27-D2]
MTTTEQTPSVEIHRVLERMRALDAELPERDGVAVFNRVYLSVTEEMARRTAGVGPGGGAREPYGAIAFQHQPSAGALGVRFAELFLTAVDASAHGRQLPACWRPLFQLRRHPGVRPLQFALAGINAHVGHDLALAVAGTCAGLDCEPAALETDFERIGDVLTSIEERVREELMPGPDLLDVADPLTHLVGSWSLARARDAAWAAARVLWGLRGAPELRTEFTERLDSGVGLVGRFLLTPLKIG